ncbi:phosphoribosyl-AMP cyclohydrolase [Lentilactobacillus sp. IMAU92037]|nr:phosphoribosyl-AMP cyclohydrolase [Lentilactobacillus dabitei]MBV0930513.1 phosphoribosyl-AMP cyclohydrolase [Lentilactobacillus dabitei]
MFGSQRRWRACCFSFSFWRVNHCRRQRPAKPKWGDRTLKPDFEKYPDRLVPTIVVDDQTDQVLMMAYVNEESYQLSLKTMQTWFWSRSRKALWHKGETSGNTQQIVAIQIDCDEDTLLMRVIPAGPACHTGHTSCFYRTVVDKNQEE